MNETGDMAPVSAARGSVRERVYGILEHDSPGDILAFAVKLAIAILIVINVVAVSLETEPDLHARWQVGFLYLEWISVALFSIEYGVRVWAAAEDPRYRAGIRGRLRYMATPLALVDLLAVAPAYLGLLFGVDARILRAIRLLRIFKLSRNLRTMGILMTVVRRERGTLISAIVILVILMLLAATGVYLLEQRVQPHAFGSIPRAMWWASATLTTVGYGDVVPITVGGKVLGVFITILGVGMAALPAGIIASGFTAELNNRREQYEWYVRKHLANGKLSAVERHRLADKQEELRIGRVEAMRIIRNVVRDQKLEKKEAQVSTCPHCGGRL